MRRLLIVLLLPVVAQFGIHYFRVFAEAVGEASVDHWEEDLNAQVEKEFPRG
jgi:hypothetical protein